MINKLIKLATHLDSIGFHKEASYLDAVIRKNHHNTILKKSHGRTYDAAGTRINENYNIKTHFGNVQDALNEIDMWEQLEQKTWIELDETEDCLVSHEKRELFDQAKKDRCEGLDRKMQMLADNQAKIAYHIRLIMDDIEWWGDTDAEAVKKRLNGRGR